jgi:hypothetical protein
VLGIETDHQFQKRPTASAAGLFLRKDFKMQKKSQKI